MLVIQTGDKVRHPKIPEWGVGKVMKVTSDGRARVFFIHAGEKILDLKHVDLKKVEGAEAKNFILDSPTLEERLNDKEFRSLHDALAEFKSHFPEGFEDPLYRKEERTYKVAAHELFKELLNMEAYAILLTEGNFGEIVKRTLHLANKTNLIFPNEKMALKDGLKTDQGKQQFAEALFALLYGEGEIKSRFETFAHCLEGINAAKWTIATYFLFLAFPEKHMFLKPTVAQHAAKLVKAELNYRSDLNWLTYKCLLEFSQELKSYLMDADMAPRDMIDVQSFMWCITPGKCT